VAVLFRHNNIFVFIRQVAPVPVCWLFKTSAFSNKLAFDLLTLKVVYESCVTWATYVPILVFIGLSVHELGPMYAIDRQTDVRQKHRLMPPPCCDGGISERLLGAGNGWIAESLSKACCLTNDLLVAVSARQRRINFGCCRVHVRRR